MNYKLIITLFFILINAIVFAQSRKELENKKIQNQKEIEYTNKLLNETKKDSENSLNKLVILKKKISYREELIQNIKREINYIDSKIEESKKEIDALEKEMKKLKGDYAKLIIYSYKHKDDFENLMFLLASKDFNQAYKRLKYLQQYSDYRRKQAGIIVNTQSTLNKKIEELEQKRADKQNLLTNEQEESIILNAEKSQQNEILISLKSKEKELKQKLKEQFEISRKLEKEIERIIAEEARKAAERAKKNSNTKTSAGGTFEMTPEEKLISDNFDANKGLLPWPTERGIITGYYGEHPHPVLSNITVQNNGIDITTTEGSTCRVIFEGEVSKVVSIPGANKAVLIRHGNYFTLYSNLDEVYVKSGDKVKTKQNIGKIHTDSKDGKTYLHFEIWQESSKMNPSIWLSKKQ